MTPSSCRPINAVLLFIAALGLAAPCQAEDAPWMPLEAGKVWRFSLTESVKSAGQAAQQSSTASLVCGEAEDHEGRPAWPLTFKDGTSKPTVRGLYRSSATTIELIESSARTPGLLPADFAADATRQTEIKVGGAAVKLSDHVVDKPGTVKVPAGEFEARRVSASLKAPATTLRTEVWYVRGVGPVKIVETVKTGPVLVTRTFLLLAKPGSAQPAPKPEAAPETDPEAMPEEPGSTAAKPEAAPEEESSGAIRPPASRGSGAGFRKLVSAAHDGDAEAKTALRKLALALLKDANAAAGTSLDLELAGHELEDKIGTKLVVTKLNEQCVIARDGLKIRSYAKECFLFVDGPLSVGAYLKECVVVVTGSVQIGSYAKDCLIISLGGLQAGSYLKDSIIEVKQGQAGSYTKDNVFLGAKVQTFRATGDRTVKPKTPPSARLD